MPLKKSGSFPFSSQLHMQFGKFVLLFHPGWCFALPWLCEMPFSGPPRPDFAAPLHPLPWLMLQPWLYFSPLLTLTPTPATAVPMRKVLSAADSAPAKPISQPALLTALGWASRRQIRPDIAALDLPPARLPSWPEPTPPLLLLRPTRHSSSPCFTSSLFL